VSAMKYELGFLYPRRLILQGDQLCIMGSSGANTFQLTSFAPLLVKHCTLIANEVRRSHSDARKATHTQQGYCMGSVPQSPLRRESSGDSTGPGRIRDT
jgi:hypothetical protein